MENPRTTLFIGGLSSEQFTQRVSEAQIHFRRSYPDNGSLVSVNGAPRLVDEGRSNRTSAIEAELHAVENDFRCGCTPMLKLVLAREVLGELLIREDLLVEPTRQQG